MTIAKRLILLVVLPFFILLAIWAVTRMQMARVEERIRFAAESRVMALARLGDIARTFAEMRVHLSGFLLATNTNARADARKTLDSDRTEFSQLLNDYADKRSSGDQGRRHLNEVQTLSREWMSRAEEAMSLEAASRKDEALALLSGSLAVIGEQVSQKSSEWINYNEKLATEAGQDALASIGNARRNLFLSVAAALALSGVLGFLTFRRIVGPIRALQTSVESIANGDYAKAVPFTQATDETGALARSVDLLKQGAVAMEEQRWVKSNAAKLTGELQGATSLAEFGQRLTSGLVPLLGGGVGAFYAFEEDGENLRRIAGFGLTQAAEKEDTFRLGQGLVGQCARQLKPVMLDHLPPDYLRISSGLGESAPLQAAAWPLVSRDMLLGVLEFASFRALKSNERALLEEVLPVAGMSMEILQRNVATQELLGQTQEQARQLEEQTEELTQSQEELLAQKEELLSHRQELCAKGEQLKASEERSRLILESTAEGIFGTDLHGHITFVNPAACRMLGFTVDELCGQPCHATFHHHRPDGSAYPVEECPMHAAYTRGEASRVDDEVLWCKNGTGLPVEYGATPLLKDGTVVGSVIMFTDIRERKRAEEESAYRLAFRNALLETIPYPMLVKDAEARVVGCNKAYEREFGITSEALKGKTMLELSYLPEADRRRFHDENLAVIREANRRSYELPIQYADGRTHITLYSVDGFKLGDGSPGGLIELLVDISDQKRVAEELQEAKARAEEATEMKSMFLANMSHEIRTPMNAIIGLSHLALRTNLNSKQRDYISKVHNAGTSLLGVINDILDFSKIEAGKLDLETIDFKLDEVIASVTTLTAQKAHEKGLEFLAHVGPGIPEHLRGDSLRLGQVLTNLVNNAVKFTERGEIRLKIDLLERTGEKVQLKLSVSDTGIGMTREQSTKLFEPFVQADMSTTRKHGGTGLGLTICQRLVELMGGRIWLESEPGVGSTFYFTVWLGVGVAKGSGKIVPARLAKLRVLVVDDNPTSREILQEPLSRIARHVDTVASGQEAIAALKKRDASEPYDIVFMDWRMPGMDGLLASRHIKSDETLTHQPAIVLVTAFGREEVREEAERLQLDGFLVKPVTKSMLVDTLINVFAETDDIVTEKLSEEAKVSLQGARILLVEDNEINQQIATELLESAGASIEVANHGGKALEILSKAPQPVPYDVVLMDLQMPELDGYQTTAQLRANPRFARLPIIAMTAHATVEERQRCLAAGMNDHISKPIDPTILFDVVGQFYKPLTPGTRTAAASPGDGVIPSRESLPPVDGLDTKEGLTRVAGNHKLYIKLLRQFIEQQGPAVKEITAALEKGHRDVAERIAHTLRGVAGNIGAKTIQSAADGLERLIHEGAETAQVETAGASVVAVIDPLVARIRRAFGWDLETPDSEATLSESSRDPALIRDAAERLKRLLSEFDPGATDFLESNSHALRPLFPGEKWSLFKQNVENYAFSDAQAQVERALQELQTATTGPETRGPVMPSEI